MDFCFFFFVVGSYILVCMKHYEAIPTTLFSQLKFHNVAFFMSQESTLANCPCSLEQQALCSQPSVSPCSMLSPLLFLLCFSVMLPPSGVHLQPTSSRPWGWSGAGEARASLTKPLKGHQSLPPLHKPN